MESFNRSFPTEGFALIRVYIIFQKLSEHFFFALNFDRKKKLCNFEPTKKTYERGQSY